MKMPAQKAKTGTSVRVFLPLFLITSILLVIGGAILFVTRPWKNISFPGSFNSSPSLAYPTADGKNVKNVIVESDEEKTVFLKAGNGAVITVAFPQGAVARKSTFAISPLENDTGVMIRPEGTKFLRPVSISFDLTDSADRSDAPDTVDRSQPRESGNTHLYLVDEKQHVSPILIARGMETSVLVTGKTLFSGAYVLKTDDDAAEAWAKATLEDESSYFFSVLESSATLLTRNRRLTDVERRNASRAVAKVLNKKSAPLFELYAAMVVEPYLKENKSSLIPTAFAQGEGFDLEANLRQTCSSASHSVETYINAELLAEMKGFTEVARLCRETGDTVLRDQARRTFDNPNASFEDVMVMIGYVKSIEGTQSTLLKNMESKLEQVVDRDIRNIMNNRQATLEDIQEVWERKAFTIIDPALSQEFDRVRFTEARDQIEKILAKSCATTEEVYYAKSLVLQYQLDDLKSRVDAKQECSGAALNRRSGNGNPPPPPPGGSNPPQQPPEVVGSCNYMDRWSCYFGSDNDMCTLCYSTYTDDIRGDFIESNCVTYPSSQDAQMWERYFGKQCKMDVDWTQGQYTDPDWQPLNDELPLEPLNPQESGGDDDLPLEPLHQDESVGDDELPLEPLPDSPGNDSSEGDYGSDGGNDSGNPWDIGL